MKRLRRPDQAGNTILYAILIVLVVAVIGLVGVGLKRRHDRQATVATTTAQTLPASSPSTATSPSNSGATDNQALTNDLGGITNSLSQGDKNLSSTNGVLGDQSQQIAVPTN